MRMKLVTIVVEPVLEPRITAALKSLGASGYTVTEARGAGSRGTRMGEVPGEGRRIETVVSPAAAERILQYIADHYFADFAVIAFANDVEVLRGEKYGAEE
jgi:nitrogen regulatory protein P-II 2